MIHPDMPPVRVAMASAVEQDPAKAKAVHLIKEAEGAAFHNIRRMLAVSRRLRSNKGAAPGHDDDEINIEAAYWLIDLKNRCPSVDQMAATLIAVEEARTPEPPEGTPSPEMVKKIAEASLISGAIANALGIEREVMRLKGEVVQRRRPDSGSTPPLP